MSSQKSLYRVISEKSDYSDELQVSTVHLVVKDKYDGLRHRGSRWAARAYTATLRRYLARRPHIDYEHEKNWARKISYIPYGFRAWAEYMPGGFATYYVYEPHHKRMANGKRLDGITKRLFRHGIEGSGIRNRSYALSYLVNDWAKERTQPLGWLSIGCGSGQPTFDAARQLPEAIKKRSTITLVDRDRIVLDFAQSLYEHQAEDLPRVEFSNEDAFRPKFLKELSQEKGIDVVDILGLFEYLDEQQSIEFLREIYTALDSGGILIFSNMDVNRPDYDINQRVIGWPALVLRSPGEMLRLIAAAGIPKEEIRFVRTQDAINNIFEVTKR